MQTRSDKADPGCFPTAFDAVTSRCIGQVADSECAFGPLAGDDDNACDAATVGSVGGNHTAFRYSAHPGGGGGFQTELELGRATLGDALNTLRDLEARRWIDAYTREIDVDLTLYSPNTKLWVAVRLALDVDHAGGLTASEVIDVLDLDP